MKSTMVGRGSSRLRLHGQVILALTLYEIKLRFRTSRSGYFLMLAEPVFQYAAMFAVFYVIQRHPAFGISLGVFLATGIVPYFLFMHLSSRVMGAVRSGRAYNKVQTVGFIDQVVARTILEFITLIVFGTAVFATLIFFKQPGIPERPLELVYSVVMIGIVAFGVGLINGVLSKIFKLYALIYSILARSMLFVSGVFYVPATLPRILREYLSWNPLLHGLEWFRLGFFESYPAIDLDRGYVAAWAMGTVSLGLVMIRACKGRLQT